MRCTRTVPVAFLAVLALSTAVLSGVTSVGTESLVPRFGSDEVHAEATDESIRASMATAHIPGLAVGVVQDGHVVYLRGYGVAGPDGRPVTPQTPFILGSTSKSFTALAVMQLVEAGRIELDAPVTRYLPWFRTSRAAESAQITVRHLLHHTSGLSTYEGLQGFWDNDQRSLALENGVRALSHAQLRQQPGERYEYSNANYNALGMIVQAASGMSYEEYVRSSIFRPLGMHHSAAALSDTAAADVARGYRHWLLWPVPFDAPYPRRMTPAGFLISSADDLSHYVAALLNGGVYEQRQLLSPQGVATLHTPAARINPSVSYGMGWAIRGAPGATTVWHDGDVSNFHSHLRLLPDQQLGLIVLMNVGGTGRGTPVNDVVDGIAAAVLRLRQVSPRRDLRSAFSRFAVMVPVVIALLWMGCSYRSLRRWPRRFWRLYAPLAVELSSVAAIWILLPAAQQTTMGAIALFAPDVFAAAVLTTGVALACAVARVISTSVRGESA
jgi:CubicO group peptidase (beta-lactamase class C family)